MKIEYVEFDIYNINAKPNEPVGFKTNKESWNDYNKREREIIKDIYIIMF